LAAIHSTLPLLARRGPSINEGEAFMTATWNGEVIADKNDAVKVEGQAGDDGRAVGP
jgi:uncharacterized protein (DUF427 family)